MTEKHSDPDGIRAVASNLERAAIHVDEAGASMPAVLDAGPLTPLVMETVHEVVADAADLVLRLHAAGAALRQVASRHEATERGNVETLDDFFRDLSGDQSIRGREQ